MDAFSVPKKVNRHVLKALDVLGQGNKKSSITTAQILAQVKLQMRNLVPIPNVDMVIRKSLKNLSDIGLIEKVGAQHYAIPQRNIPGSSGQFSVDRRYFKPGASRKRSISQLNPNFKRAQQSFSDDSLSGDDYDRARKTMRSNNKKIKYVGRKAKIPKARKHSAVDNLQIMPIMDFAVGSQSDTSLPQNLGMSMELHNGLEDLANRDYASTSSLVINEISPAKKFSTTVSNITELYTSEKFNSNDNESRTALSNTSSEISTKTTNQPSKTSVVPTENSTST